MNYKEYELKNDNGYSVKILNLGGIIKEINMPDKDGNISNVVLGYDNIEDYAKNSCFFGTLVGRTSGRIREGKFTLNNIEYNIPIRDRGNALHGGLSGFDNKIWNVEEVENGLKLTYLSKDGEEGYPGNLNVEVIYILTNDNELEINYKAVTDKDTLVNLTNHTYIALNNNQILDQELYINSDRYLELDETSIPTGKLIDVKDTPMDFRVPKEIGLEINSDYYQVKAAGGYDHPWRLNPSKDIQVSLYDKKTRRKVSLYSDQRDVVIYSYNFPEKNDKKHSGLAIEFHNDPDGINHNNFDSSILKKGEVYNQKTVYKFEVIR